MWKEPTMSIAQSLVVSGMGMLVVVGELAILAIAIIVLSKVLGVVNKKPAVANALAPVAPVAAAPIVVAQDNLNDEAYAVLIAAVSEETHMPLNSFQVTEIKEI